jgi:hypothetical protein
MKHLFDTVPSVVDAMGTSSTVVASLGWSPETAKSLLEALRSERPPRQSGRAPVTIAAVVALSERATRCVDSLATVCRRLQEAAKDQCVVAIEFKGVAALAAAAPSLLPAPEIASAPITGLTLFADAAPRRLLSECCAFSHRDCKRHCCSGR